MANSQAFTTLLGTSFKRWISAKGFWLVVLAALFPVALTGAWAGTHTDDVAARDVAIEGGGPVAEGDVVNFTAVIANVGKSTVRDFNASLSVGRISGNQFAPLATEAVEIDVLEAGATRELRLEWTAAPGAFYVLAYADAEDALGEVEELNNQQTLPLVVRHAPPSEGDAPAAPGNLTGTEGQSTVADLAVALDDVPQDAEDGANLTFTATVTNNGPDRVEGARVVLRAGFAFQGEFSSMADETANVTLEPGASEEITLSWNNVRRGAYWAQAYVITPSDATDPNADDNAVAEGFTVQPRAPPEFPDAPENATIKDFFLLVLLWLHLPVLIPFIALFYAGGVLNDERDGGTLTYLLTAPFGRWMIPMTKFVAGFVVALVAVLVGLVLSFAVLFGTSPSGADLSFLWAPVATSVLALLVYGALFTLLGVIVDRPYLVGVAFILGWEVIARNFVPWVANLTVIEHLRNLLDLSEDLALQFAPDGLRPVYVLVVAGVAFLAASAYAIQQREFQAGE